MKIPQKFKLFNHEIKVVLSNTLQKDTDNWGLSRFRKKEIIIENGIENGFKEQTFLHELTHMIFDYMNERDIAKDERLVNTFSELLYQAFETMEYKK